MNTHDIKDAHAITCDVLNYGSLNPPISSGGNISGPLSSTDKAIVRYMGTTGGVVENSPMTLSDDAKLAANSNTIDMSASGVINLSATTVNANTHAIVTSTASSVTDSNIVVFNSTTGHLVKDSAIGIASIAAKLPLAGGTMSGDITMATHNLIDVGSISGAVKTSAADALVTSSSGLVADSDIAVFDSTTGKIIKDSSVQVSIIATKLPLAGGTMSGVLNMGTNNITNVGTISGSVKTINPNATVTSSTAGVTDSDIVIFDSTSGNIVKDSGVQVSSIATKLPLAGGTMSGDIAMATHNITNIGSVSGAVKTSAADDLVTGTSAGVTDSDIVVFNSTTGRIIKTSGVGVASIATKLPLAGGTMMGDIAMGTHNITNAGTISGAANSRTADNIVGNAGASVAGNVPTFADTTGKVIQDSGASLSQYAALSGATFAGDVAMGGHNVTGIGSVAGTIKTSAANDLVTSSTGVVVDSNIVVFDATTGRIIKDSGVAVSAIAAKLPLAGGTMSGDIAMATHNITNAGTISGATNSRTADNIVSNAGTSVASNVAIFSGTSGKVITDSGASLSQYLPLAGGTMSGTLAMGTNNITNVGSISGAVKSSAVDDLVTGTSVAVTDGDIVVFNLTTGRVVKTSGIAVTTIAGKVSKSGDTMSGALAMGGNDITNVGNLSGSTNSRNADNIVSNAGISVSGNVATFSGTSGKVITDSGSSLSQYLPLAGGTMTGDIVMGTHNITNAGTISGATNSRTADNIVSNAGAGVAGNVAIFSGATGKVISDSCSTLSQYLPLAGGTMSGTLIMGNNEIQGISALRPQATNFIAGNSATVDGGTSSVVIGDLANISVAARTNNVVIGPSATSSVNTSVVIGSTASSAAPASVAIGLAAATSSGASSAIGASASASNADAIAMGVSAVASAVDSIAIGTAITNATASSVLLGDAGTVNWRPANDATCDLGTGAARFHDLYLSHSIQGAITITSPTLVTPNIGVATATSVAFSPTTGGITGTTTNDNASAGTVGEIITSTVNSGSAVSLSTGTGANVTSISLTTGDWDVDGNIYLNSGASTVLTSFIGGISTSSTNVGAPPVGSAAQFMINTTFTTGSVQGMPTGTVRASLSGTTTYYLVVKCVFSTSTISAYGGIRARRVR